MLIGSRDAIRLQTHENLRRFVFKSEQPLFEWLCSNFLLVCKVFAPLLLLQMKQDDKLVHYRQLYEFQK